jgi:hypothetical protein
MPLESEGRNVTCRVGLAAGAEKYRAAMADDRKIGRTIGGQFQTVSSRFFAFRDESTVFGDAPAEPVFKPLQRDFRAVAGEGIEPPTRFYCVFGGHNWSITL